jgi:hypothetical protein
MIAGTRRHLCQPFQHKAYLSGNGEIVVNRDGHTMQGRLIELAALNSFLDFVFSDNVKNSHGTRNRLAKTVQE